MELFDDANSDALFELHEWFHNLAIESPRLRQWARSGIGLIRDVLISQSMGHLVGGPHAPSRGQRPARSSARAKRAR